MQMKSRLIDPPNGPITIFAADLFSLCSYIKLKAFCAPNCKYCKIKTYSHVNNSKDTLPCSVTPSFLVIEYTPTLLVCKITI